MTSFIRQLFRDKPTAIMLLDKQFDNWYMCLGSGIVCDNCLETNIWHPESQQHCYHWAQVQYYFCVLNLLSDKIGSAMIQNLNKRYFSITIRTVAMQKK